MYSRVIQGTVLGYRALFTWLNPLGYISSRILRPIGLSITFGAVGAHYGAPVGSILVGASLLAGAHAVIFGMALAVGNERWFGTLDVWLASPQNKVAAICQRALPHIVDGYASGLITYLACSVLFGTMSMPIYRFASVLVLTLVGTFGFGVLIGGLSLVIEDVFTVPNMAYLALTVLSGALVSTTALPDLIEPLSGVIPLYHTMQYVNSAPSTSAFFAAAGLELCVSALWFLFGLLVIQYSLARSRRP